MNFDLQNGLGSQNTIMNGNSRNNVDPVSLPYNQNVDAQTVVTPPLNYAQPNMLVFHPQQQQQQPSFLQNQMVFKNIQGN
eukprot:Pgem_evm1s12405